MIYFLQRIWWYLKATGTPFMTLQRYKERCEEFRAFREYRRARWSYAGKGFLDHIAVYLRYNRWYGHAVIASYALSLMILGAVIFLLIISWIPLIGG